MPGKSLAGAGLLAILVVLVAVALGTRKGAPTAPTASTMGSATGAVPSAGPTVVDAPESSSPEDESQGPPLAFDALVPPLESGGPGLFLVRQGGTGSPSATRVGDGNSPAWSPDGRRLAFIRKDDTGLSQLFVYDVEAETTRQITNTPGAKGHPTWDADGTRIAYATHEGGHYEVFLIRPDGSDPFNFTRSGSDVNDLAPEWSPDGRQIAYRSDRDGNNEVYVQPVSGGVSVNVSRHPGVDVSPAWVPDGKRIVWSSDRGGALDLYSAAPDGSGLARLTTSAKVLSPTVSPDGRKVVAVSGGRLKAFDLGDKSAAFLREMACPGVRLRGVAWSRSGERAAFARALPDKDSLRQTGNGRSSVVVGPFPTSARATREAWSLEISGFYSDVCKQGGGWFAVVGRKFSPDEAGGLVRELERARFTAAVQPTGEE
jgi:TolB protein